MGRSDIQLRAEDASTWSECNARIERELASRGSWVTALTWASAGFLFADGLIACASALSGGGWLMWALMLGSLAGLVVMASRAASRADQNRRRNGEIARLREAWLEHLDDEAGR